MGDGALPYPDEIFPAAIPSHIYHYGTFDGFLGIIQSKHLWASSVSSLNDAKEAGHARDVVIRCIEREFQAHKFDNHKVQAESALTARNSPPYFGVCVISFSEGNDILSQWRAYADQGRGISIGFDAHRLKEIAGSQNFMLGRCIYDDKIQERVCAGFVKSLLPKYSITDFFQEKPQGFYDEIRKFCTNIGLFFKHRTFEDEREWRIVSKRYHIYDGAWRYRANSRGIVPYVELNISDLLRPAAQENARQPIILTLGPNARREPTATAVQAIMNRVFGVGYGVGLSNSPFLDR